jgi:hypothetical protein
LANGDARRKLASGRVCDGGGTLDGDDSDVVLLAELPGSLGYGGGGL